MTLRVEAQGLGLLDDGVGQQPLDEAVAGDLLGRGDALLGPFPGHPGLVDLFRGGRPPFPQGRDDALHVPESRGDQGRVGDAAVGAVGGEVRPHRLDLAGGQLLGPGLEPLGHRLELGGERVAGRRGF